jgi:hypothetical protein
MEPRQLRPTGDEDPPPCGRIDAFELDAELEDGLWRYARRLRGPEVLSKLLDVR